ncbi:hypothetical protein [Geminocystis herdmanii]|uniref:hypothetical protein n=1 Tax=Geminocystis herdmanii TaxID=669359 RepID=UPI0003463B98|nr:hypothetical protein [Geminocystis herdmanii]
MNIQETVLDNLKDLTVDKQKTVLDFVKFLRFQQETQTPSNYTLKGLWADLDFSVTEDDITSIRQEMWSTFAEDLDELVL